MLTKLRTRRDQQPARTTVRAGSEVVGQRWPDYSIYRAWFAWYAVPKGCQLVAALYPDSLDERLREATQA